LIEDNKDKMHIMAKALLEWETIDTEQVDDIMRGLPPRPPKNWTPSVNKQKDPPQPPPVSGEPVEFSNDIHPEVLGAAIGLRTLPLIPLEPEKDKKKE